MCYLQFKIEKTEFQEILYNKNVENCVRLW